jgi:ADP-dependent NAD(P)H-hydrate dehydratase / NAD(P)H-hydrate epimerase
MKYVSVSQMLAIEEEANRRGISYDLMMKNAGQGLAKLVNDRFHLLKDKGILGLIGSGNNGGDTLVALAWLAIHGWNTSAYLVNPRDPSDPLLLELQKSGGRVYYYDGDQDLKQISSLIEQNSILLDGILGTGFQLPLRSRLEYILKRVNEFISRFNKAMIVVAVDCPSGIDCDTGNAASEVIRAHLTITMAAIKQGLLTHPAFNFVGEIELVGIGLPEGEEDQLDNWKSVKRFVPGDDYVHSILPNRPSDAHKGTFGTAVIVAGSSNFPGASLLAGAAAYRIGAGLVTLAVPKSIHPGLIGQLPEATWILLPDDNGYISPGAVEILLENLTRVTAILIGPGLSLHQSTEGFIKNLINNLGRYTDKTGVQLDPPPLVIDADGLKLLSKIDNWQNLLPCCSILTPHPGEMSILTNKATQDIQKDRVKLAEFYSSQWNQIVVLKGAFSVIASPDGRTAIIPVATPALARAGTGDVLAGLITGLRAQGIGAFESAVTGAWIHAKAGLLACKEIGNPASVIAGDIVKSSIKIINNLHK